MVFEEEQLPQDNQKVQCWAHLRVSWSHCDSGKHWWEQLRVLSVVSLLCPRHFLKYGGASKMLLTRVL